jgi:hypothetical protein
LLPVSLANAQSTKDVVLSIHSSVYCPQFVRPVYIQLRSSSILACKNYWIKYAHNTHSCSNNIWNQTGLESTYMCIMHYNNSTCASFVPI